MQASELIARFEKFAPLKLKWEHDPPGYKSAILIRMSTRC